jgi:hypothetical protein
MAQVKVTFVNDQTSTRAEDSEVDDQQTARQTLDELQAAKFLSPPPPGAAWTLDIKGKASISQDSATLASAGIANGDIVIARIAQRGGNGLWW